MQIGALSIGILAGGKSSRMGSNKAELRYGDSNFLEYILLQAQGFGERLLSVDDLRKYQWLTESTGRASETAGVSAPTESEREHSSVEREQVSALADGRRSVILVEDELKGYGPVEGIYQLLRHIKTAACLIAATDMPGLTEDFLRDFAGAYKGEDCLVLRVGGILEPLCSIYNKNCIPVLETLREEGIRRPRLLFDRMNTRYLDIEDLGYGENVVSNINTPEEYHKFVGKSEISSQEAGIKTVPNGLHGYKRT